MKSVIRNKLSQIFLNIKKQRQIQNIYKQLYIIFIVELFITQCVGNHGIVYMYKSIFQKKLIKI